MRLILLLAACVAVATGCAGPQTAVRVRSVPGFGPGEHTYAFVDASSDATDRQDDARYASAVARRLAALGYVAAPMDAARYRVALSYDTHPAAVLIADARCAGDAPCGAPAPLRAAGFVWPGAKTYVHSLTVRFFDRAAGREVYAVSASERDREPHADHAIDYLVVGALARVPFEENAPNDGSATVDAKRTSEWKVTFGKDETPGEPRVRGVAALPD